MKHRRYPLALIALLTSTLALAGCGSGGSSSPAASDGPDYTVLQLVSAKDASATVATALTWMQTPAAEAQYVAQFPEPLKSQVTTAFKDAKVPAGDDLFASIVSVGCGVPTSAVVIDTFTAVQISPTPAPEGCAKPTTTVAVVVGPAPE